MRLHPFLPPDSVLTTELEDRGSHTQVQSASKGSRTFIIDLALPLCFQNLKNRIEQDDDDDDDNEEEEEGEESQKRQIFTEV